MRTESFGTSNNQENIKYELKENILDKLKIPKMKEKLQSCLSSFEIDRQETDRQETDVITNKDETTDSANDQNDINDENLSEINYLNKLRQPDIKTASNDTDTKENLADHFTREAQSISRNKDLYLKLVNTAIYGNFNYKYYENPTNYNKAAEYFALYGFGDSLDSTFQFNNCNNKANFKPEDEKKTSPNKNKTYNTSSHQIVHENNPISTSSQQSIQSKKSIGNNILPKALNFISSQQVLMHLNQPGNLSNYQSSSLIPYGNNSAWMGNNGPYFNIASAAAAAYFNETHINTSIIQQQQFNFFGSGGPYDIQYLGIYYAQLLQRSQRITQSISANNRLFEQHPKRTTGKANQANQLDSTASKQINNNNSSGNQPN